MSGQKVRSKTCPKYLGVLLDENLIFKDHINFLKEKLDRANDLLAKLRHNLPSDILKTVYYSLFDTHLCYACYVWGQSNSYITESSKQTQNLKKETRKTLRGNGRNTEENHRNTRRSMRKHQGKR